MKIKNWNKFQHFKDRRPPWIKLHRDILEQRDISVISDCSFRVLVGLWLLASESDEMDGSLPSVEDIQFRLRIENSKLINALRELSPFLLDYDIEMISERYQNDDLETETETYKQETKKTIGASTDKPIRKTKNEYPTAFESAWSRYPKRAGANPKRKAFSAWGARIKSGADVDTMLAGVDRYTKFITETGKASTEFVMQAATFFGPDEHFLGGWDLPAQRAEDSRPRNDAEWMELGRKTGVSPGRGESMQKYISKIQERIRANSNA